MRVVAGLDFGGTATRFVVHDGRAVIASRTVSTADFAEIEPDKRVSRLAEIIRELVPHGHDLHAIGIGATGPVDRDAGVIRNPDTLPMLSGIALIDQLKADFSLPVTIDNDAVVAAIAEQRIGAGKGASRMLMVTLGTGVGVALIIDGAPFRGSAGAHPEGGHIPVFGDGGVRCYCGALGCWETVASRSALQAALRPCLPPGVSDKDILSNAAALTANADVSAVFDAYGEYVGRGLSALHTIYMPEISVLGGSAARYLDLFRGGLLRSMHRAPGFAVDADIRQASLGDEAGALGAALMVSDAVP